MPERKRKVASMSKRFFWGLVVSVTRHPSSWYSCRRFVTSVSWQSTYVSHRKGDICRGIQVPMSQRKKDIYHVGVIFECRKPLNTTRTQQHFCIQNPPQYYCFWVSRPKSLIRAVSIIFTLLLYYFIFNQHRRTTCRMKNVMHVV